MLEITKLMIKEYNIKKLGYDFMGYELKKKDNASFHHLVVARRNCEALGLGDGYYKWNGAILNVDTSHPYLHIIESKDPEIFYNITSEMIDMNVKGYLDKTNLEQIDDLLCYFEKEHDRDRTRKGKILIKDKYLERIHIR
jgi:hypothetical protein